MASITTLPETKPPAPIERTEHPHVVKSADTLGGEPRVDGHADAGPPALTTSSRPAPAWPRSSKTARG